TFIRFPQPEQTGAKLADPTGFVRTRILPKDPPAGYCRDSLDVTNDIARPLKSDQGHPMTTDDPDAVALRPTVIGGARQDDDYEVVWRGFPVGRMMKQADSPDLWSACTIDGLPPTPNDRGPDIHYNDY